MSRHTRRNLRVAALAVTAIVATSGGLPAQPEPMLEIEFDPALSIRQLARDYLGDADLWPEILKSSGIASIVDLEPGQMLRLPVSQVKAANKAIRLSAEAIERANEAGAQLFAPRIIGLAIGLYDRALVKRTLGAWLETFDLAQRSRGSADEAHEICRKNRDRKVEARLSDRQGTVQGQKPGELTWEDRELNALLSEEEKVRTLSDSTAQITFRDASRLRLAPNSQAVIQRLRVDPLTRREEAKVSLIEGDFYALLADESSRKSFEVEVPGVEARVDSGDFWVSHDAEGAKFANYDAEPVRVEAGGETVILGQNEGTLVATEGTPTQTMDVLPAPDPQAPPQDRPAVAGQAVLRWTAVEGAVGYWLEIAQDPEFQRLALTERGLTQPRFAAEALEPGIYHWRVSALDRFGLPGARTDGRRLEIRSDTVPPYLRIDTPEPGAYVRQAPVILDGRSEPGARLTVDGAVVEIDADGRFRHSLVPAEGEVVLVVRVRDRAGNETSKSLPFTYMPDRPATVEYAPEMRRLAPAHFLVRGSVLSLAGKTVPRARLRVADEAGAALAEGYADGAGRFRLNVPLAQDHQQLSFAITAPSGFVTRTELAATIDRTVPEIRLAQPPPRQTRRTAVTVRGRLSEAATLRLNGARVDVVEGRFEHRLRLREGRNSIQLAATDAAGNVGVREWMVRVDRTPPELVDHRIEVAKGKRHSLLHLSVSARDASGLAHIAPFTLTGGTAAVPGYLRYDPVAQRYRADVEVRGRAKAARLRRVVLTDGVGNARTFTISEVR